MSTQLIEEALAVGTITPGDLREAGDLLLGGAPGPLVGHEREIAIHRFSYHLSLAAALLRQYKYDVGRLDSKGCVGLIWCVGENRGPVVWLQTNHEGALVPMEKQSCLVGSTPKDGSALNLAFDPVRGDWVSTGDKPSRAPAVEILFALKREGSYEDDYDGPCG